MRFVSLGMFSCGSRATDTRSNSTAVKLSVVLTEMNSEFLQFFPYL